MYSKTAKYIFFSLVIFFSFFTVVKAHSGRTDSSGGHNCYTGSCAGTYHYHNGGSAYTPPTTRYTYTQPVCNKPQVSTVQARINTTQVDCKHNVTISWDKGIGDEQYSIDISKNPGGDPGPVADTTSRRMSFNGVSSGKWYINMKAGNSCGWSDVYYWETEVPDAEISVGNFFAKEALEENTFHLYFQADCAESISISPDIGTLNSNQISKGYVTVNPTKDTTYKLTVKGHGQTKTREENVKVVKPAPSPSQEPTDKKIEESKSNTEEIILELSEVQNANDQKQTQSNDEEWFENLSTHLIVLRVLQFLVFKF